MEWHALSKTIQDAVIVARRLNIRYLWIDSLCIVKDDADDWERQSAKIASIYGNAYITISASGATDGDAGIFSIASQAYISKPLSARDKKGFTHKMFVRQRK